MLYDVEVTYRAQFEFNTVEDAKNVYEKLSSDDYYYAENVDDTIIHTSFAGCVEPINDTIDIIKEMGYRVEYYNYDLEHYDENDVEYVYYLTAEKIENTKTA